MGALSSQSGVPINLLMSIGEVGGASNKDEALQAATHAASVLSPLLKGGMKPEEAIAKVLGPNADPSLTSQIMSRAYQLADELNPGGRPPPPPKGFVGDAMDALGTVPRGIASAAPAFSEASWNIMGAMAGLAGLDDAKTWLQKQAAGAGRTKEWVAGKPDTWIGEQVQGAAQSIGTMAPGILASILSGGAATPAVAATFLAPGMIQQGGQSVGEAEKAGKSDAASLLYGGVDALAEGLFEKIPVHKLLGDIVEGSGFGKILMHQLMTEVPTEVATTLFQNMNAYASLNPDKPMKDFLAEQPAAIRDTIVQTMLATVGISGLGAGVSALTRKGEAQPQTPPPGTAPPPAAPGGALPGGSPSTPGAQPSGGPGAAPGAGPSAGPSAGPGAGSGPMGGAAGAAPDMNFKHPETGDDAKTGERFTARMPDGTNVNVQFVKNTPHGPQFRFDDGKDSIISHADMQTMTFHVPGSAPGETKAPEPPPPFGKKGGIPFETAKQAAKGAKANGLTGDAFQIIAVDGGFMVQPLPPKPGSGSTSRPKPDFTNVKPQTESPPKPAKAPDETQDPGNEAGPAPVGGDGAPKPQAPQGGASVDQGSTGQPDTGGPAAPQSDQGNPAGQPAPDAGPGGEPAAPAVKPGFGADHYIKPDDTKPHAVGIRNLAKHLPEDWQVSGGRDSTDQIGAIIATAGRGKTHISVTHEQLTTMPPEALAKLVMDAHDKLPPDQQSAKRPDPATIAAPTPENVAPIKFTADKAGKAHVTLTPIHHEGKGWTSNLNWDLPGHSGGSGGSAHRQYFSTPEEAVKSAAEGLRRNLTIHPADSIAGDRVRKAAANLLKQVEPYLEPETPPPAAEAPKKPQTNTPPPPAAPPVGEGGPKAPPKAPVPPAEADKPYRLEHALTDQERKTLAKYRNDSTLGHLVGELDAATRRAEAQMRSKGHAIDNFDAQGQHKTTKEWNQEATLIREAEDIAKRLIEEARAAKTGDLPEPKFDEGTGEFDSDGSAVADAMDFLQNFESNGVNTDTVNGAPKGEPMAEADVPHMDPKDVFPERKGTVSIEAKAAKDGYIPQAEADAKLAAWKQVAKDIGKTGKNAGKIIISLFDYSGQWSQPWRDAGYQVIQHDIKIGSKIGLDQWINDQIAERRAEGYEVYGVLAATPCTTFSGAGARWWEPLHDIQTPEALVKVFGEAALASGAKSPLEYNIMLVNETRRIIEESNPTGFHVLENPVGRIEEKAGMPAPTVRFHPHNFGDPYTKRTQLYGMFQTDLPTANVDPVEGSKMQSKLRGTDPLGKEARSTTPFGFSYAFFMANDPQARERMGEKPAADDNHANPNPTPAQAEAGNYQMKHIKVHGLDISIETEKAGTRKGTSPDGKEWSVTLAADYGYIKGTVGKDKDHVDVYVGPNPESKLVVVVDQNDLATGKFDEHKILMGFDSASEALKVYEAGFSDGKGEARVGGIKTMEVAELRALLPHTPAWKKPISSNYTEGDAAKKPGIQHFNLHSHDKVTTPQGRVVKVDYGVVSLDDLVISNDDDGRVNKAYPSELQPRDRSHPSAMLQVQRMATNLNPEFMGEGPEAGPGAPIVSKDGVVESGNGRMMALRRAYVENGKSAEAYRAWLKAKGYPVHKSMKNPVLIRLRTTEMDTATRIAATKEYNERTNLGMTVSETAMADAGQIQAAHLALYRGGDLDSAGNRDFVRQIIKDVIGENDAIGMIGSDGSISQAGLLRIQAALLAKAYGSPDLIKTLMEASDTNIKAIGGALTDVAGEWAKMRAQAAEGVISPHADMTPALMEAVQLVDRARRAGRPITDFVNQTDMFAAGGTVSDEAKDFLSLLFNDVVKWTKPASRERIGSALAFYVQEMGKTQAEADMFGHTANPRDVLKMAKGAQDGTKGQGGLFDKPTGGPSAPQGDGGNTSGDGGNREKPSGGPAVAPEGGEPEKPPVIIDPPAVDAPQDANPKPEEPPEKIDDFGGKIEGARKHLFGQFVRAIGADLDIATNPLGKTFPPIDAAALAQGGAIHDTIAVILSIRRQIPLKPQGRTNKYKLARWVNHVSAARKLAKDLLDGTRQVWDGPDLDADIRNHIKDYEDNTGSGLLSFGLVRDGATPQEQELLATYQLNRVIQYKMDPITKSYVLVPSDDGKTKVRAREPDTYFLANGPHYSNGRGLYIDTMAEVQARALAEVRKIIDQQALDEAMKPEGEGGDTTVPKEREIRLSVKSETFERDAKGISTTKTYGIWSSNDENSPIIVGGFETYQAARDYITANEEELRNKVRALRVGPREHRLENRERSGMKRREGNVSTADFEKAFGLRVEFGASRNNDQRQLDLNRAYDAFMDLAGMLGIPSQAIAVLPVDGKTLGIGFASRGRGGRGAAAAHYEQLEVVINLTAGNGSGSLAHEWVHALDNYLAREAASKGGVSAAAKPKDKQRTDFASDRGETNNKGLGDGLAKALQHFALTLKQGPWHQRNIAFDTYRKVAYWGTTIEETARAFEAIFTLALQTYGMSNDYLVNIDTASGAYPAAKELQKSGTIAAAREVMREVGKLLNPDGKAAPDMPKRTETLTGMKIGDTWASPKGERKIVSIEDRGAMLPMMVGVSTAGGKPEVMEDDIADGKRETDAYLMSPQAALDQAKFEADTKRVMEEARAAEDKKAALKADYDAFTAIYGPMSYEFDGALLYGIRVDGKMQTPQEFIHDKLDEGWRLLPDGNNKAIVTFKGPKGNSYNTRTAAFPKKVTYPYIKWKIAQMEAEQALLEAVAPKPADANPTVPKMVQTLIDTFSKRLVDGDGFHNILVARKVAAEALDRPLADEEYKLVEEALEAAVVITARHIISQGKSPAETYTALVDLYARQPLLAQRTSTSLRNQAYSTPAPLAYLASQLAGITEDTTVYEPTVGNGMLLIGADPAKTTANELDPARAARASYALGSFMTKISVGDAMEHQGPASVDVVIANPPFGKVMDDAGNETRFNAPGLAGGGQTTEIDHAIALRALQSMKKDGRAVLIVGGQSPTLTGSDRAQAYSQARQRRFWNTIYDQYNVVGHFTVAGSLYARQGAQWPVDVIVIEGRGESKLVLPMSEAPPIITSWTDLEGGLNGPRSLDTRRQLGGSGNSAGQPDNADDPGAAQGGAGKPNRPAGGEGRPAGGDQSAPGFGDSAGQGGGTAGPGGNPVAQPGQAPGNVGQPDGSGSDQAGGSGSTSRSAGTGGRPAGGDAGQLPPGSGALSDQDAQDLLNDIFSDLGIEPEAGGAGAPPNEPPPPDALAAPDDNPFTSKDDAGAKKAAKALGGNQDLLDQDPKDLAAKANRYERFKLIEAQRGALAALRAALPKGVEAGVFVQPGSVRLGVYPAGIPWAMFASVDASSYHANSNATLLEEAGAWVAEQEEKANKPKDKKPPKDKLKDKPNEPPKDPAQKPLIRDAAGNIITETGAGFLDGLAGLVNMLNNPSRLNSGLGFDEEDYQRAKPQFLAMLKHFGNAASSIKDLMRALVQALKDIGLSNEGLQRLMGQLTRLAQELASGAAKIVWDTSERVNNEQETDFQVQYTPRSGAAYAVGTLIPVNMQYAMNRALDRIEQKYGKIDTFVAKELGYSEAELTGNGAPDGKGRFSAEQIDALAMAIDNVKDGKGFIIGDQTGVGKGRVVAGMIRYARKNGITPIFVTKTPGLYLDMIRDLTDIGEGDSIPEILATNTDLTGKNILRVDPDDPNSPKVESLGKPALAKAMQNMRDGLGLPQGKTVLFTTYSQLQEGGDGTTLRQEAVMGLAENSMFIMDEAHEAGGDGETTNKETGITKKSRGRILREMLATSKHGTLYSSATFAKNPDVLSLYFKTDMSLVPGDLAGLLSEGGVPLQQISANLLVEAGQYIRRERSYAGVKIDSRTLKTNSAETHAALGAVRAVFMADEEHMQDVRTAYIKNLQKGGHGAVGQGGAVGSQSATSKTFSSMIHNIVGQVLLAAKSDAAIQDAIEAWKNGEKPIIALANTNDSIISEYAEDLGLSAGDAINITFNDIILRYLQRLRRIGFKDKVTEVVTYHYITDAEVVAHGGQAALRALKDAERTIRAAATGSMSASPIDKLKAGLEAAGMKVGEITGRGSMIHDGKLKNMPNSQALKAKAMAGYNSGALDALIINSSGSTGFSLHATATPRNDGKPRYMMVLQPDANIDVFMQMLGRIHRTGQIHLPRYSIGASDLAIEQRVVAQLMRKMASLNANTTAAKDSAVTMKNVKDFLNRYGDIVVNQWLAENVDQGLELGFAHGKKPEPGLASRLTGRLAVVADAVARKIYEDFDIAYTAIIAEMDRLGTNTLEAKTLNLEAETLSKTILSPSVGTSPFQREAVSEIVKANVLAKPYTEAELKDRIAKILDGKKPEMWALEQMTDIRAGFPAATATANASLAMWQGRLAVAKTDAQKRDANAGIKKAEDRLAEAHSILKDQERLALTWKPGASAFLIRDEGNGKTTRIPAISLGIDMSRAEGNAFQQSKMTLRLAVADSMREFEVPVSRLIAGKTEDVAYQPEPSTVSPHAIIAAFANQSSVSREDRTILTGNLVAGFKAFEKGQIMRFTRMDGTVSDGILMPKSFDTEAALRDMPVQFSTIPQVISFLNLDGKDGKPVQTMVVTSDSVITITHSMSSWGARNNRYSVILNTQGGRPYATNKQITSLVGDFNSRSGRPTYEAKIIYPDKFEEFLRLIQSIGGVNFESRAHKDEARTITGAVPPGTKARKGEGGAHHFSERGIDFKENDPLIEAEIPGELPMTKAEEVNLRARLLAELKRVGAAALRLNVAPHWITEAGDEIYGMFYGAERKIWTSWGQKHGALAVLRHELLHWARDQTIWNGAQYGAFTAEEWRALVSAARMDVATMAWVKKAYDGLPYAWQVEEVIADRYMAFTGRKDSPGGPLSRAYHKFTNIIHGIINVLRGRGYINEAMIFEKLFDGSLAERAVKGEKQVFGYGFLSEESVASAMRMRRPITQEYERTMLSKLLTQAMSLGSSTLLSAVPGRALFTELGRKMPSAENYQKLKDKMDKLRSEWWTRTDEVARRWRYIMSQNKNANVKLMDLMHEATIAGQDPSQPYEPKASPEDYARVQNQTGTPGQMAAATERVQADRAAKARYDALVPKYRALPGAFKHMFNKVRDEYVAMSQAYERAIIANIAKAMNISLRSAERAHADEMRRIQDDGLIGGERAQAMDRANARLDKARRNHGDGARARAFALRKMFESNRVEKPYFPLTRFGKFFVTTRNAQGKVTAFNMFESVWARDKFANATAAETGIKPQTGVIGESEIRGMVDPTFVSDIEQILAGVDTPKVVMDAIWQRWLETLPELSIRRNRLHRNATAGFSSDAFRAFGKAAFHGSHQLAKLSYALDLQDALVEAEREAKNSSEPTRNGLIVQEMMRRHQGTMAPKGSALSQLATSAVFLYFMAFSPGTAIVNISQTTIVGIPILGSMPGANMRQASAQIARASLDFTRGKGHAVNSSRLTDDEKTAMEFAYASGLIDKSRAHDLAGIEAHGTEFRDWRSKIMAAASLMLHHTERMNREITFLAAYRMARINAAPAVGANGGPTVRGNHDAAVNAAMSATWKTHFDYQNDARPRLTQGNVARVVTAMKNFQINMLWRLARDLHQMTRGESPEARKEARRTFFGISASLMLHAGISGVWMFGAACMIWGLLTGAPQSEVKDHFKSDVVSVFGEKMGAAVFYGIPQAVTGLSLSSRIGMPDLWFRDDSRPAEGEALYQQWLAQSVGAAPTLVENMLMGAQDISNGDYERGIEKMLPVAARNVMKAARYAMEGATTKNGDPLVDTVTTPQVIVQALGFTPAEIAEQNELNSLAYNKQQEIQDEKSAIVKELATAVLSHAAITPEIRAKVDAFNAAHPSYPITSEGIVASAKLRAKHHANNQGGAELIPGLDAEIRAGLSPQIMD
jgi:hypothetical protein